MSTADDGLRARIAHFDGSPRLNTKFESSVAGLHFVGLPSAQSFGPVMRFVFGTKHAATILARHLRAPRRQASQLATRAPSLPLSALQGQRVPPARN